MRSASSLAAGAGFKALRTTSRVMVRRVQISVVGFDADSCTEVARDAAYRVGRAIAKEGGTVVCGGLGGVMEATGRGARDAGGHTVGIVPSADPAQANEFCDFVVATGLGGSRDFVVAYSGDAVIVVGGGAGTLIEVAAAYQAAKPIVAVKGTGGVADAWAGRYMDDRQTRKMLWGSSPEDAVKKAVRELARNDRGRAKVKSAKRTGA
jgi:uncharacterized protein (TIGR00725 family)